MTVKPAAQIGIASIFILSSMGVAQGYAPLPKISTFEMSTAVKTAREVKPLSALETACTNPGKMADDGTTIYIKVDQSSSAIAIPVVFANENWDAEKRQFPLPENLDRVLCPV